MEFVLDRTHDVSDFLLNDAKQHLRGHFFVLFLLEANLILNDLSDNRVVVLILSRGLPVVQVDQHVRH